jgi:hypothetical protein
VTRRACWRSDPRAGHGLPVLFLVAWRLCHCGLACRASEAVRATAPRRQLPTVTHPGVGSSYPPAGPLRTPHSPAQRNSGRRWRRHHAGGSQASARRSPRGTTIHPLLLAMPPTPKPSTSRTARGYHQQDHGSSADHRGKLLIQKMIPPDVWLSEFTSERAGRIEVSPS